MAPKVRVRFAPSPTGFMHLGNVRTALYDYLFAQQRNGKFILRIEDTDQTRSSDELSLKILQDLEWLGLPYHEGPVIGGPHFPYVQSERQSIYQRHLDELIAQRRVYRCFCTPEHLEEKRKEQIARGLPPRYDRVCLHLSDDHIKQKLVANKPFIWRFKLNDEQVFTIQDLAHGTISFEMKNFSDFALTRADGTFTFLFVNFIDDWLMRISHVIRGEDHMTNTAVQAALYDAFAVPLPIFWHLSMICNAEGKKLSKRDFGFSLEDLKQAGYLPQAICNYLAIIGRSLKDEIQSYEELARNLDFDHMHASGLVRYDVEKLTWMNHKWIERLSVKELLPYVIPFLQTTVHQKVSEDRLLYLLGKVKSDCKTAKDFAGALRFCFEDPVVEVSAIDQQIGQEKREAILPVIVSAVEHVGQPELFLETVKRHGQEKGLKPKEFFGVIRYLLTGNFAGLAVHDVLEMLTQEQMIRRLQVNL